MPLAVNDIILVTTKGHVFNSAVINTWHFRVQSTDSQLSAEEDLTKITEHISQAPYPAMFEKWLNCLTQQFAWEFCRAQRVFPTKTIYSQRFVGVTGEFPQDQCNAPNVAASVERRTNFASRRGVGRVQLGGVPTTKMANGVWDPTYVTDFLTPFAANLGAVMITSTPSINLKPVLYHKGFQPAYHDVIGGIVQDTVRTMNRRTLFRGE